MIRLDHLTKTFGGLVVVDDVSLVCSPGRVTALAGPSGSGKTTMLRLLLGLTRPDHGSALIGGHRYVDIPNPGRHVGVLLETPGGGGGRTGHQLLVHSATMMGVSRGRISMVLEEVGLDHAVAGRPLGRLSLRDRQRLGIAHALLGDPAVLLLDEPTVGLEESDLDWLGSLLGRYSDRGGTALVTSNRFHDVEALAHRFVLVSRGRVRTRGDAGPGRRRSLVRSTDDDRLAVALRAAGLRVAEGPDGLTVSAGTDQVGRVAAEAGAVLVSLADGGDRLEQAFARISQESQAPVVPQQRQRSERGAVA